MAPSRGWVSSRRNALGTDLPGADVLVPVRPRPQPGSAVVQVDHDEPLDPDECVEPIDESVDLVRLRDPVAGAPRVRGVDAEPDLRVGDAARGDDAGDVGQLLDRGSHRVAAAGGVLKDDHRRVGALVGRGQDAGEPVGDVRGPGHGSRAPMRAGVDVDETGPEPGGARKIMGEDTDRSLEEIGLPSCQVDEVGRVDREWPDVEVPEPVAERGLVLRGLRAAMPGRWVVAEDLERARSDRVGPLDGLDHPAAEGQVCTESPAVGEHRRHPSRRAGRDRPAHRVSVLAC